MKRGKSFSFSYSLGITTHTHVRLRQICQCLEKLGEKSKFSLYVQHENVENSQK